jgi:hypothetical protein
MKPEKTLSNPNFSNNELKIVKELVFDKCGFNLTNLKHNKESLEYTACSFQLNGKSIQFRSSKITPTKTGQFVTIWKRNNDGITEPFDTSDDIDFLIITSKSGYNFGLFIFPKSILVENGIFTSNSKKGKRGMRVYTTWDIAPNKQAERTQRWQTKHFISINKDDINGLEFLEKFELALDI